MTYLEGHEWKQISLDIRVATKNNIIFMYVLLNSDSNRTVYHLIHEIVHTVTLAEQYKNIKDYTLQLFTIS